MDVERGEDLTQGDFRRYFNFGISKIFCLNQAGIKNWPDSHSMEYSTWPIKSPNLLLCYGLFSN